MCDYDLQWTQPWAYRRALQSELLRKNRFMSVGKVPGELFPWERIGRCRAVLEEVAGKAFPVLIVESWEGREMAKFALDERPSIAEIRDWLKSAERELSDETELAARTPAV